MERIGELIENTVKMTNALQRVEDRLDVESRKLKEIQDTMNRRLDVIQENTEKINVLILGNGIMPGLAEESRNNKADITAMKEKEKNWGKHVWALYIGVCGAVVEYFLRFFQK